MKLSQLSIRARLRCLMLIAGVGITLIASVTGWQVQVADQQMASNLSNRGLVLVELGSINTAQTAFALQIQEFKNMLIRGQDPEAMQKHKLGFDNAVSTVQKNLEEAFTKIGGTASDARNSSLATNSRNHQ